MVVVLVIAPFIIINFMEISKLLIMFVNFIEDS